MITKFRSLTLQKELLYNTLWTVRKIVTIITLLYEANTVNITSLLVGLTMQKEITKNILDKRYQKEKTKENKRYSEKQKPKGN